MARGKRNKAVVVVSALQRMVNRDRVAREADVHELGPVVNDCAAKHGDYVPAAKTGEMRHALVNRGGSPVDRWTRDGALTDHQLAAIAHIRRLWQLTESGTRLVANLDRTVFGCPGDGNMAEKEARHDLHRIINYFPFPMDRYWDVFENVVRFDEPAGVAGSRLATNRRSAIDRAYSCVCYVADTIFSRERMTY
jgi:hypothetical protein